MASLEAAAEHERILREIESTDTNCIGPTLRWVNVPTSPWKQLSPQRHTAEGARLVASRLRQDSGSLLKTLRSCVHSRTASRLTFSKQPKLANLQKGHWRLNVQCELRVSGVTKVFVPTFYFLSLSPHFVDLSVVFRLLKLTPANTAN